MFWSVTPCHYDIIKCCFEDPGVLRQSLRQTLSAFDALREESGGLTVEFSTVDQHQELATAAVNCHKMEMMLKWGIIQDILGPYIFYARKLFENRKLETRKSGRNQQEGVCKNLQNRKKTVPARLYLTVCTIRINTVPLGYLYLPYH